MESRLFKAGFAPISDLRIADVHVFKTNRTAIDRAKLVDDLLERGIFQANELTCCKMQGQVCLGKVVVF